MPYRLLAHIFLNEDPIFESDTHFSCVHGKLEVVGPGEWHEMYGDSLDSFIFHGLEVSLRGIIWGRTMEFYFEGGCRRRFLCLGQV